MPFRDLSPAGCLNSSLHLYPAAFPFFSLLGGFLRLFISHVCLATMAGSLGNSLMYGNQLVKQALNWSIPKCNFVGSRTCPTYPHTPSPTPSKADHVVTPEAKLYLDSRLLELVKRISRGSSVNHPLAINVVTLVPRGWVTCRIGINCTPQND